MAFSRFASFGMVTAALAACHSAGADSSTASTTAGTSTGGAGAAGAASSSASVGSGAGGAKPVIHCTLDNGTDPVGLCIQKLVLTSWHDAGFKPKSGAPHGWDSKTFAPDADGNGKPLHDARDDLRYAAAIAQYHDSAARYGDTEAAPLLDGDLAAIAPLLVSELTPPPNGYDGDFYRELRTAAGGLRVALHASDADALDALAESYGRAIHGAHFFTPADGNGGIIGDSQGAAVGYDPAMVATAALALVDLARRHPDETAKAAAWQAAAAAALDRLHARARDATTGLVIAALVTSGDPAHDAPSDASLRADTTITVALALLRAKQLVEKYPAALGALASYPFEARAEALLAALAPLWSAKAGGYLEGLAADGKPLDHLTTRANARAFGAVRRASLGGNFPADNAKPLRATLTVRTPAHTSLLSVVSDQVGFFRRAPISFDFTIDSGPAAPFAHSYASDSDADAIDGLSEGWYGLPD